MRCGCRLCFTEARLRSACAIGEAGAAALAKALEKNTVLRDLNLTGQYAFFFQYAGSGGFYISCCLSKCGFGGRLCVDVVACVLLKRGHDQETKSSMRALQPLQELWRQTRSCKS